MATSLSALLTELSVEQIFNILLGVYKANGFPVESWQEGGTERTRLMAYATALNNVSSIYIPAIAGGGFLDYANTDWLRLTAFELYEIIYNKASFTKGNIKLTSSASAGPFSFAVGELLIAFADTGHRYSNDTSISLASNSNTTVQFQAEFAGSAYSDASDGVITLVSAFPGLTATNPSTSYSDVGHTGAGSGTLTLGGSPVGPHFVIAKILSSGFSSTALWSTSLDGAPYVDQMAAVTVTNLGGTGINITRVDNPPSTSFVDGDIYTFATPGSWITTQGADDESDSSLANRCRERWSTLSPIPTLNFYTLLATSVPGVLGQVAQVLVFQDTIINNQVNIVVSGPAGPLDPSIISTIQDYINPRVPITDLPVVVSPTTFDVALAGTVTVTASQLATAKAEINSAMAKYVNESGINPTIRLARIEQLVMDITGVIDITGLTINTVAANLVIGSTSAFYVPVLTTSDPFTYITV